MVGTEYDSSASYRGRWPAHNRQAHAGVSEGQTRSQAAAVWLAAVVAVVAVAVAVGCGVFKLPPHSSRVQCVLGSTTSTRSIPQR